MEDPEVEQVTLARPVSMMQVALSESREGKKGLLFNVLIHDF
jgi:hypothetical protein